MTKSDLRSFVALAGMLLAKRYVPTYRSNNEPWICEGINELIKLASPGVRSGCAMSKHCVTNGVNLRVGLTCVDEFTMICSLFVNKEGHNFPECR